MPGVGGCVGAVAGEQGGSVCLAAGVGWSRHVEQPGGMGVCWCAFLPVPRQCVVNTRLEELEGVQQHSLTCLHLGPALAPVASVLQV